MSFRDSWGVTPATPKKVPNVKVMWGEPPKPHLWEVVEKGEATYVVRSPILEGEIEIDQNFWTGEKDRWRVSYRKGLGWPTPIAETRSADLSEAFSSVFYKKHIEPLIMKGEIKIKVPKVAFLMGKTSKLGSQGKRGSWGSTGLSGDPLPKVMWGDPPKPYLWQASRQYLEHRITSPLFKDLTITAYNDPWSDNVLRVTYTKKGEGWAKTIATYKSTDVDYVFTNKFYKDVIKPLIDVGEFTPTAKVASNSLKAQWGDPPKPYLWNTYTHPSASLLYIESPLFKNHRLEISLLHTSHTLRIHLREFKKEAQLIGNYLVDEQFEFADVLTHDSWIKYVRPALRTTYAQKAMTTQKYASKR